MNQFSLFEEPEQEVSLRDGGYLYIPHFFDTKESSSYFNTLMKETHWKQEKIKMYGKEMPCPRLMAWYGEQQTDYSFSGISLETEPWTETLLEIKSKVEKKCKTTFNSVLLNLYRNGNDSISWHSDDEKELGTNPLIASVSFGGTRKFKMRHKFFSDKLNIDLTHGSLLIVKGETQHFWEHEVPKTKKIVEPRINLTFRTIEK